MAKIEFSHITTRGGDEGKTSLINGERRFKSELVFEVLGTIDELSSSIGLARSHMDYEDLAAMLRTVQQDLVVLGGHVATPPPGTPRIYLEPSRIDWIEGLEADLIRGLEFKGFVLPGDSRSGAFVDMARTVCRRTERLLIRWIQESHSLGHEVNQRYLNRLSDFLFVLARQLDKGPESST